MTHSAAPSDASADTLSDMMSTDSAADIAALRQALLADMQAIRAAVPDDDDGAGEAVERRARIITMMTRCLEVMVRLQGQATADSDSERHNRQALLADIEQKLARLAQS